MRRMLLMAAGAAAALLCAGGMSYAQVSPAAPPAIASAQPVSADAAKVICKSTVETGSLIRKHKTCLTRQQWGYVNDESQRVARDLVDNSRGRPGSN